ncbi:MAG: polyphosphate kinase 1 [Bacteroidales bacterium]|nr:polyphosphate kinase 1 [Bacteroidales bacterium]
MAKEKWIVNREISWLAFNHRVLQEARDPSVPLIERLRFLGIFSDNLDEFFKVRVASLRRMVELDIKAKKLIGGNPEHILKQIQQIVLEQQKEFENIYFRIIDALKRHNIYLVDEHSVPAEHEEYLHKVFHDKVLPALNPIMLDTEKPFPQLKDKSIYLAIKLTSKNPEIKKQYALMEVPAREVGRFIILPPIGKKKYIIILDDVIRVGLPDVFSIYHFNDFEAHTIKITRDAELDIDNDMSKSFLEKITKGISERKKGQPVRLVYDQAIPKDLLNFILKKLELDVLDNIIPGGKYHNFKDFMKFPNIGPLSLQYKKIPKISHPAIRKNTSILESIREKDLFLHFPYHPFSHFLDILREAVIDPYVTEIKMTAYRVAYDSKVMNTLINACQNGKNVTVVIELQARFNEASNIYWSKKLQEAGANVFFGIRGLKVHAKLLYISRKKGKETTRYAGISTGNFNEETANVYVDIVMLTANPELVRDTGKVFKFLESPYLPVQYQHFLTSPVFMRRKLCLLVDRETRHALDGKDAYIFMKLNNLVDQDMIMRLYKASQAGVKITLLIRGICSLIPGEKGLSENIEVYSLVGRYLEHSRIMIFCNDNKEEYYIGSADWMTRNLDHRVEIFSPVFDKQLKAELRKIMELQLQDNVKTRIINKELNNVYKQDGKKVRIDAQMKMYRLLSNNG